MTESQKDNETQVPRVWREATPRELSAIKNLGFADPDLSNALIYTNKGELQGWLTYKILEPDEAEPKRHLFVSWWTIEEGARSPKAASIFLSNFYDFLIANHIDVVDFDVRDDSPYPLSETETKAWNEHRNNLIAVYSKLVGQGEYVPEIKSTMFSCSPERIGTIAKRGAIASLFPQIP